MAEPSGYDLALGAAIRRRRIAAGMSLQILAQRIGVQYQQVFKYEHAKNRVASSRLAAIAAAFGATVADLEADARSIMGGTAAPANQAHERGLLELSRAARGLPVDALASLTNIARHISEAGVARSGGEA